jgi:hypothetical protein
MRLPPFQQNCGLLSGGDKNISRLDDRRLIAAVTA